jgi:hypothetical protein
MKRPFLARDARFGICHRTASCCRRPGGSCYKATLLFRSLSASATRPQLFFNSWTSRWTVSAGMA